jgi:sugar lactone lactonase YvrE
MKHAAVALAFFGFAAVTAMGQQSTAVNTSRSNVKNNLQVGPEGHVWCGTSPSSKPQACTAIQVAQLNKALAGMKTVKGPTSGINSIALAKDGSLMCASSSGTVPCTSKHLPDLKEADARVNSELENVTGTPATQK